jgi:hypothetical protein
MHVGKNIIQAEALGFFFNEGVLPGPIHYNSQIQLLALGGMPR